MLPKAWLVAFEER